jgi:hypothetical protein
MSAAQNRVATMSRQVLSRRCDRAIGAAHRLIHRKLASLSGHFRSNNKPRLALNLGEKSRCFPGSISLREPF